MRRFSEDEVEVVNENLVELCLFSTGGITYAAEIEFITDIIEMCQVTFVPGLPRYIKGIINLRGKIVPVMDLRMKINPKSDYTINDIYPERSCIVVIRREGVSCGLMVEEVIGIESFDRKTMAENPDKSGLVSHIFRRGEDMVQLLESMKLQNQF